MPIVKDIKNIKDIKYPEDFTNPECKIVTEADINNMVQKVTAKDNAISTADKMVTLVADLGYVEVWLKIGECQVDYLDIP